jgi:hypothetical protein
MRATRSLPARRGYSLMLVLVFLVLLLSMLGMTGRQLASALRVEVARSRQVVRDEGSLRAVAGALAALEAGPLPSQATVSVVPVATSAGQRWYAVTVTPMGGGQFSVIAAPSAAP